MAAGLLDENHECLVGVGDGAEGAGEVAAVVVASASFFLECLCFAGDVSGLAAGVGAWPSNEVVENPINTMIRPMNLFMAAS